MVIINGNEVPTCRELAKLLEGYGDRPLFSGNGWFAVTGFYQTKEGTQVVVIGCPPEGKMAKDNRRGGV